MVIRQAQKVDLCFVRDIAQETIKTIYPKYYPKGAVDFFIEHHNDGNIARDIEAGYVFITEIDEIPVGTVTIQGCGISRLFVLPKYQRRGYGKVLIDFAEECILENFDKILIDSSIPAKGIYLKRGYKEVEYHKISTENGDYLCYDVMEKVKYKYLDIRNL